MHTLVCRDIVLGVFRICMKYHMGHYIGYITCSYSDIIIPKSVKAGGITALHSMENLYHQEILKRFLL